MKNNNGSDKAEFIKLLIFSVILSFSLFGCGGGGSSGGGGGDTAVDCTIAEPDEICGEDSDGDSLTYSQEVIGWEVAPDRFGLGFGVGGSGQTDAIYKVTSDVEKIDTDGDGLDDYQEFINKSDPRLADTDGDGLSDSEELARWKTSPLSIDSDGDSRGPDKDLSPNSQLFDAAELRIDLVNDPTHRPGAGATSPVTEDTDGDGWTDYYEIVDSQGSGFDPVIADVPLTKIEIAASPVIRLTGSSASETNWSRDVAVSDSIGQSVSTESAVTRGTEQVIESTIGVGAEFGVTTGFEIGKESKWTGSVSASISTNLSLSASMATSHSVSWTEGQSQTAESTYQESLGEGGSDVVTLDGGYVSVPINLVNNGDISFTLTGLRINVLARYMNGTSDFVPVLELKRIDDIALTLGPGQSYPNILMQSDTDDYELIRSFLKNPSGLLLEVSSYTLEDADGVSYSFAEETIKQKTAAVIIDYGGELPPERYLVATSPQRSVDIESGVTMATVMNDIINTPYETFVETTDVGTFNTLSGVKTVINNASLHKHWLVTSTSKSLEDVDLEGFDDIVLNAGDAIYFMYIKDQDSDGLAAREEFLQGTSDMVADSDSDGLTDFEEVREGWSVKIDGQLAYDVQSRGYRADSDSDGLDDAFEKFCGLDPIRSDTDQDNISDNDELYGYDIMSGQTRYLKVVPYAGQVILDGGNAVIDTPTPANDDVLVAEAPIEEGDIIISAGTDGVLDTTALGDDYVGVNHIAMNCEPAGFATNPLNIDTDGESMPDGLERDIALGSPNNSNDVAVYADTDGDGLSDAVETLGFSSIVNGVNQQFVSDPDSGDSDADGLPDLLEYMLKSNPSNADTDGDTLVDLDEYDFVDKWSDFEAACNLEPGCTPPVTQGALYGTNLNNNDSDTDGLNDAIEINGWQVSVDGGQPTVVTTSSAVIREDSDLDGLFDNDEYTYRTHPQDWDTDRDGMSDGNEISTTADIGGHRDPVNSDRKITLEYNELKIDGYCDFSVFWVDLYNEYEWMFKVKTSQYSSNYSSVVDNKGYLLSTSNGATIPLSVQPTSIWLKEWLGWPFPKPAPHIRSISSSLSFILPYGENFEFYGYLRELDHEFFSSAWNLTDRGFMFHDPACIDCENNIVNANRKDTDISKVIDTAVPLRFDVNNRLTSQEFEIEGTINCWQTDPPGVQNMGPSTYTISVGIEVD